MKKKRIALFLIGFLALCAAQSLAALDRAAHSARKPMRNSAILFFFMSVLPNRHFVCQSSMLSSKKALSRPHSFIHVR